MGTNREMGFTLMILSPVWTPARIAAPSTARAEETREHIMDLNAGVPTQGPICVFEIHYLIHLPSLTSCTNTGLSPLTVSPKPFSSFWMITQRWTSPAKMQAGIQSKETFYYLVYVKRNGVLIPGRQKDCVGDGKLCVVCVLMCVCACVCVCVFDCEINTHWMLGQTSIDKFLHSKADILPYMKPDHTNIAKAD